MTHTKHEPYRHRYYGVSELGVPAYIIGQRRADGDPSRTSVLLAGASPSRRSLRTLSSLSTQKIEAAQEYVQNNTFKSYSDEQLRELFSEADGKLLIMSHTVGNMVLGRFDRVFSMILEGDWSVRRQYGKEALAARRICGRNFRSKWRTEHQLGITDQQFAQFDVSTHLNELATAFGKREVLAELFSKNVVQPSSDAIES